MHHWLSGHHGSIDFDPLQSTRWNKCLALTGRLLILGRKRLIQKSLHPDYWRGLVHTMSRALFWMTTARNMPVCGMSIFWGNILGWPGFLFQNGHGRSSWPRSGERYSLFIKRLHCVFVECQLFMSLLTVECSYGGYVRSFMQCNHGFLLGNVSVLDVDIIWTHAQYLSLMSCVLSRLVHHEQILQHTMLHTCQPHCTKAYFGSA